MATPVRDDRATEEAWLIARMGSGDRAALRELYQRYSGPLYSLAVRIVGEPRDAEEALQDTFVKLWTNARAYDAAAARPFTWAVTIARRTCIDRLRRRGRLRTVEIDAAEFAEAPSGISPLDVAAQQDDADRARAAIAALPAGQRAAIELAVFGGIPHSEVAARLQQPIGTVKSWIRRGLQELRNATRGD